MRLKELRIKHGFTQHDLAKKLNVSSQTILNWENEIEKFAPGLSCLKLSGTERKDLFKEIPKYDVVITSYALIRRDIAKLKFNDGSILLYDFIV